MLWNVQNVFIHTSYLDPHSGNFIILQLKYFLSYTIKECNLHFKTVFFKTLVKMKYRKLRCMANRINFRRPTLPFRRTALKKNSGEILKINLIKMTLYLTITNEIYRETLYYFSLDMKTYLRKWITKNSEWPQLDINLNYLH